MNTMSDIEKDRDAEIAQLADNSAQVTDEVVYRGFVDESLDPEVTYDFGETLVMISPLGTFVGSTPDGKPQDETVDEESARLMAMQTEEILLDKDHGSMRPTAERDTQAMGWVSGLKALVNLGDMSGLYGVIKWTEEGRRLVETRAYRFLSPVFQLDESSRAVKLLNIGLTNRPALKTPPIINGEPESETKKISITSEEQENHEMTKEEIVEIVKETIESMKPAETKEEASKPEATNEAPKEVPEKTEGEKLVEELKSEELKSEELKSEKTEPEKTETETSSEVIKEEALNSAPVPEISQSYENLHGKAFFDWCKKNGYMR